jgi:hypothetical protein
MMGPMTGVGREGCLERGLVQSLAAGRCPKDELATAQRHLSECARCRSAVVATASGVRGPGETVVMMRRETPKARAGVKVAAVAVSLLVAGWAWGYGAAPKPAELSRAREVVARAPLEPSAAPANDPVALREATPSPSSEKPAPEVPAAPELPLPVGPTVAVVTSAAVAPVEPPPARRRRNASRVPRPPAAKESAAKESAAKESAKPDDEVDFGIDEPAPRIRKPSIRTTLD